MLQKLLVHDFFERIATSYHQSNQSNKHAYHGYFFNERIDDAIIEIGEFCNQTILDVGAGTGTFYDALNKLNVNFSYKAIDLSASMLAKSTIPKSDQLVGDALEMQFPQANFDIIVLLGVSTYMTKEDMHMLFDKFNYWLSGNGKIIATFTNKQSIDFHIRSLMRPLAKFLPILKSKVIQQKFDINAYTISEIKRSASPFFLSRNIIWQNQTISPFNQLFSRPSIYLAQFLKKHLPGLLLPFISSDFMVIFQKHPE